jgi:hypothetical protein
MIIEPGMHMEVGSTALHLLNFVPRQRQGHYGHFTHMQIVLVTH